MWPITVRKTVFLLLIWLVLAAESFSCAGAATLINKPWQVTMHPSKQDNPPGCVHAYSDDTTFDGHFAGVVWPGSIPALDQGNLYLVLNKPLSVCAYKSPYLFGSPQAYVNVSRIGLWSVSAATYDWVMQKWGDDDVRLTGTLNVAASIHALGPLHITVTQFCYRNSTKRQAKTYQCQSAAAWQRSFPSGTRYQLCVGVECEGKRYRTDSSSVIEGIRILQGAAPNSESNTDSLGEQDLLENRPTGCLSYWPATVVLRGRLGGILQSGTVRGQGEPAVGGLVSMSLSLDQPISLCAVAKEGIPAYKNIKLVGIGLWSIPAAELLIGKWGDDEIEIAGSIDNSDALPNTGEAYTAIFTDYKRFCSRGLVSNGKRGFICVPWDTWIRGLGRKVNLRPGN